MIDGSLQEADEEADDSLLGSPQEARETKAKAK